MLRPTTAVLAVLLVLPVLSAAPGGGTKVGAAYFGDLVGTGEGDGAEVLLYEDRDTAFLLVNVWLDTTGPLVGEFYGYRSEGLPLGAKRAGELSGRAFEIVDVFGAVVVSSELPKVRGGETRTFGGEFVRGTAPFRLRVADKRGVLQEIAELELLPYY